MMQRVKDANVQHILEAAFVLSDPASDSLDVEKFIASLRRLRDIVVGLPEATKPIRVFEGDARQLELGDESVDMVLTSPPYINVFNYHQQYRKAVELLGGDVLLAAKSEIGANRKHRSNRLLTVVQYCIDMATVVKELERVTRVNGRLIFVVGRESRVRGLRVHNAELLCSLAQHTTSLRFSMRQERVFTNRFGERIFEDILHFDRTEQMVKHHPVTAIEVAHEILNKLRFKAKDEVRMDLEAALCTDVHSSPLFPQINAARTRTTAVAT
jgi:SAM-dependent methyltransferase